jgi:hypothetical protein
LSAFFVEPKRFSALYTCDRASRHQGKQASYTGLTITRMADGGIRVTQDHFVQEIPSIRENG